MYPPLRDSSQVPLSPEHLEFHNTAARTVRMAVLSGGDYALRGVTIQSAVGIPSYVDQFAGDFITTFTQTQEGKLTGCDSTRIPTSGKHIEMTDFRLPRQDTERGTARFRWVFGDPTNTSLTE